MPMHNQVWFHETVHRLPAPRNQLQALQPLRIAHQYSQSTCCAPQNCMRRPARMVKQPLMSGPSLPHPTPCKPKTEAQTSNNWRQRAVGRVPLFSKNPQTWVKAYQRVAHTIGCRSAGALKRCCLLRRNGSVSSACCGPAACVGWQVHISACQLFQVVSPRPCP
jgi:hypothetical protein